MRKNILLTLVIIAAATVVYAQPSSVKKVERSLFTLTTYGKDGTVKSSATHGVFIGSDGEGLCLWSPFVGAERATVTDSKGATLEVETIMGANELYDVCRIRVNGGTVAAPISKSPAQANGNVWMVSGKERKSSYTQHHIEKVETFMDKYSYYLFSAENAPDEVGYPFLNDKGEVLGLLQLSNSTGGMHAVDSRYVSELKIDGLSISSPVFRQTGVRLEIPSDKEQALIMLMMSREQKDSLRQAQYVDDFIARFPKEVDGYSMRALNLINANKFVEADRSMKDAIDKVTDKAEAHAEYSRVIYQKMIYSPDTTFTEWTLDKALEEIQKANEINTKPVYKHREAQIVFSKGEYAKAYDMFMALTNEKLSREELFFEAAQCKTQLKAPDMEIISLLDSAVAACPQPLTNISSPYVLARAQVYDKMGEYRKAIVDYNTYDTLMLGRADASFYYARYKCELQIKQYQQALNDIAHAAYINPSEPMYLAELASLQLRLNQIDDAIKTSDLCLSVVPEYADLYIIKGIALMHKKEKEEGLRCFEKAKELGDERAQGLIEKYK